jgi:hypothetical protein
MASVPEEPQLDLTVSKIPTFDLDELNKRVTLTRHESAFFVRLSVPAFDQRVPDTFPPVKIGRRVLFLRTSLLAALAKLERQPTQPKPRPLRKKGIAAKAVLKGRQPAEKQRGTTPGKEGCHALIYAEKKP